MHPELKAALEAIAYPGYSRDIVSFGLVREASLEDGLARVHLRIGSHDPEIPARLEKAIREQLNGLSSIQKLELEIAVQAPESPKPSAEGRTRPDALKQVKCIIAVASGKGGVGKSTLSVNLACALEKLLAQKGKPEAVGILDCDLYGPSVPMMLGVQAQPELNAEEKLIPLKNFGISVMSMGLLVDADAPILWRGPMVAKAIGQFASDVAWGELEILLADLPPGTGDIQLSLSQTLAINHALIVTTPQRVASQVAQRGAMLFEQVQVPLLGVVENMHQFTDASGKALALFGEGGGKQTAEALQTELLGSIPLDPDIAQSGDWGVPMLIHQPESKAAEAFKAVAEKILQKIPQL